MSLRRIILLSLMMALPLIIRAQGDAGQGLNDQLWEAARKGDAATVQALLDKGADVNAKFRYGTTALFKAAERGHTEVVKLLLARGADPSVKDTFYGATAMTWALDNKHIEVVRALLEKSAEGVDEVLITGAREGNAALVRVALDRGGAKAATLTAALSATMGDDKRAEIAEMLKKAGAVPPPAVAAETLQAYVGKYRSEQGTDIAVAVKDGKLYATPAGQSPFGLAAVDQTTFRPTDFDGITITFSVEGGKTTAFTLKRGDTTTQFKRVEQ
ncbi:MAG TPA: ankyrin repeat domain-containing protein [Pyrinomonadaceae bacterium]|nr:ankyrin repeat domain-containing protein [Pyrinomonadaceae bacterium]